MVKRRIKLRISERNMIVPGLKWLILQLAVKAIAYAGDASSRGCQKYRYEINVPVTTEKIETVTVNKLTPAKRGKAGYRC